MPDRDSVPSSPADIAPDREHPVVADRMWLYALTLGALIVVGAVTRADTDLWGHVRFGQVLWQTGALPAADPYSFTSDRPWINHEWLAEWAMGGAFELAGVAGLLVLKLVLLLASLGLVSWTLASRGGIPWITALAVAVVGLTGVLPLLTTLRPQGFSVLLFAIEAAVLSSARPALAVMPLLFALWANLHGGWLMGLGVLGGWLLARIATDSTWSRRWLDIAIGVASVVATLATPYGVELWRFMWQTVGFERADVVEWQSVAALPELAAPWAFTTALGIWAASKKRGAGLPSAAACLVLAVASFRVARMVPFYSLAVGMFLLPVLLTPRPRASSAWWQWAAAGAIAAATIIGVRGNSLSCWPPSPALRLDPEAHAFLRANQLTGRLVVWFDWGEYVIWHFPDLSISMDGRRETVYSEATLAAHQNLYRNGPGAREYLESLAPDYVWLPATLPVTGSLDGWGWRTVFRSERSRIWTRRPGTYSAPGPVAPACFPGP